MNRNWLMIHPVCCFSWPSVLCDAPARRSGVDSGPPNLRMSLVTVSWPSTDWTEWNQWTIPWGGPASQPNKYIKKKKKDPWTKRPLKPLFQTSFKQQRSWKVCVLNSRSYFKYDTDLISLWIGFRKKLSYWNPSDISGNTFMCSHLNMTK